VWGNTSRVFVETKKETLPECGSVKLSIPSPCQHAFACECGASDESGELGRGLVVGPQKIGGQHERAAIYGAGNDIGVMVRTDLCFACQAQPIARCDQGEHHVMARRVLGDDRLSFNGSQQTFDLFVVAFAVFRMAEDQRVFEHFLQRQLFAH